MTAGWDECPRRPILFRSFIHRIHHGDSLALPTALIPSTVVFRRLQQPMRSLLQCAQVVAGALGSDMALCTSWCNSPTHQFPPVGLPTGADISMSRVS